MFIKFCQNTIFEYYHVHLNQFMGVYEGWRIKRALIFWNDFGVLKHAVTFIT